jgi:hypothetical protein
MDMLSGYCGNGGKSIHRLLLESWLAGVVTGDTGATVLESTGLVNGDWSTPVGQYPVIVYVLQIAYSLLS